MKIFLLSHRWLRLSFFLLIITFLSSCEFSVSDRTDQTDSSSTDASSSDPSGNSGNPGSNNMDGGELPAAGSLAKWDDSCLDIHQFPLSPLASHIAYAGMYPAVRASKFSNFYPDWKETHDELKEWGNTIFIDYGFEEHFQSPRQQQDAFISKLRYAQRARKQVVLTMSAVFFGLDQNRLGERLVLRPDFQLRWGQFANLVLPYIGSIVAFRPTDEPYWRGRNQGLSNSQVKKALDTVARMVKRTFPTKPMFLIHNSVELDSQFLPLELYEWIGFNCYRSFESCGHAQINGLRSVPEWIRLLKSYMFSHQKIALIPDGFLMEAQNNPQAQKDMVTLIEKHIRYANSDQDVIGVFPFVYRSTKNQFETLVGTDSMCPVYHYYDKLFKLSARGLNSKGLYRSQIAGVEIRRNSLIETQLLYLANPGSAPFGYHLTARSPSAMEVRNSVNTEWSSPHCNAHMCLESGGAKYLMLSRHFDQYPESVRNTTLTISYRPTSSPTSELDVPVNIR